jgi:hypothetical protein
MSSSIAVFVKNDVERPDAMIMRARLAKLASQAYIPHIDPDGWLSCHHRNDVLSAFNSLKKRFVEVRPSKVPASKVCVGEVNPRV